MDKDKVGTAPNRNRLFEGRVGRVIAVDMMRRNRDAEHEAIEILDPQPSASVLVLGCGPGVGVAALASRVGIGRIVALDPSAVMCALTSKRCAAGIHAGLIKVICGTVQDLSPGHGQFDALVAVNALQLCNPFAETAPVLGRLLRPGGSIVSMTHDWAMRKHFGTVERALNAWTEALTCEGFGDFQSFPGRAEKGKSIVFRCTR
jgi:ubiquinone/menaquinone biosynthesis C-methylase UbiE